MRLLLFILFPVFSLFSLHAQADREFWFSLPDVDATLGDRPLFLNVSSMGESGTFTLDLPADPGFSPLTYTLSPSEIKILDLSTWLDQLEANVPGVAQRRGLRLRSDILISAYFRVAHPQNQEIFNLKGRLALGERFLIPSQTHYRNLKGHSGFDIVATQAQTTLRITPTRNMVGHPAGIPFAVTLQRGETYSCRATDPEGAAHLAGTEVQANAPVAIMNYDDALAGKDNAGGDLAGDQLIPVSRLGTQYIALATEGQEERVYLTATVNNTTVTLGGSGEVIRLDAGETGDFFIQGSSAFINSSQPIYVWQMTGFEAQQSAALLLPLSCTAMRKVKYVRPSDAYFNIYLLTRAAYVDGFWLNGTRNIVPEYFEPVPGTDGEWVFAEIEAGSTFVTSTNETWNTLGPFQMGLLAYSGDMSVYSSFSDLAKPQLAASASLCAGDTLRLDGGANKAQYLWSTGDTTRYLQVASEGMYWLNSLEAGCAVSDTIRVRSVDRTFDLGSDTTLCPGDSLVWDFEGEGIPLVWEDGSLLPYRSVRQPGTYSLTTTLAGCEVEDTVQVAVRDLPLLELGEDTVLCPGESLLLDASAPGAVYAWQDSSMLGRYEASAAGIYALSRTLEGCEQTDTIRVAAGTLPTRWGADTTLCLGDTLVFDPPLPGTAYLWEDGSRTLRRSFTDSGVYTVTLENACGSSTLSRRLTFEDCSCQPFVPNVFTPNGDGFHDRFVPELRCDLVRYELAVYDRWGRKVFESRSPGDRWGGIDRGREAPADVYYWRLRYEDAQGDSGLRTLSGQVTLLR